MRYAPKRSLRRLLMVSVLASGACATGIPNADPADIPRLQREIAANPADTDVQVQLGMAQFKAGDSEQALRNLQAAVDAGNESGPALLYLGLVQEELEEWSLARESYSRYLEVGSSGAVMDEVENRLQLIGRNILRTQAQESLQREEEITATGTATPRSVAVFPFAFNSDREDLEPLIYALSDMMVTDFAMSNALVVLERAQVQTLLDEMALTEAGYAEATTGARAGRLLRAEHVVQGVLTTLANDDLQTDADVLNVAGNTSVGEISEGGALEALFDMEKQLVIRTIREALRVELTPAEEQAILDNRMENVLAFLAYGRGLRSVDRGDYADAQIQFQQAQQIEGQPVGMVDNALEQVGGMIDASTSSTDDVASRADQTGETGGRGGGLFSPPAGTTTGNTGGGQNDAVRVTGGSVTGGTGSSPVGNTLTNITEGVNPTPTTATLDQGSTEQTNEQTKQTDDTTREPVSETTGGETVSGSGLATIRIVIQRPGGTQ